MATGRNRRQILLRLASEGREEVRSDLRGVREDVRSLAREEVRLRIDVQRKAAEAQIQRIEQRLEKLSRQEASPKVEIATARALAQLERFERQLDLLDQREIDIDVDVRRGALERVAGGVGVLNSRVDSLGGAFSNLLRAVPLLGTTLGFAFRGVLGIASNLGQIIGGVVTSAVTSLAGAFGKLGGAAGPIGAVAGGIVQIGFSLGAMAATAGGAIIALNAILGAVVALGAALVALAASLAAAIGGLGALAVAFGGILGPAVLVVIGLFTRFAAIMEARKAREQALEQAVYDQKAAEDARASALEAVTEAEERLAKATVDGRRAMTEAIEEQADAQRRLEGARLGVQRARLNLRDARAELREFLQSAGAVGPTLNALTKKFTDVDFDASGAGRALGAATGEGISGDKGRELQDRILNVKEAQLGVKEAVDSVGDSERALGDARKRNNAFTEQGLRAYEPYAEALDEVKDAQNGLRQATNRSSRAQDDYRRKLKELSGTERGSLDRLNRFIDGFKRLAQAFTNPIFRAINDVFDSMAGQTGFLERGLRLVGEAFGDVIRAIGGFFREPATRTAFMEMARGAGSLARNLGARAFTDFLRIMRNIATAALPALVRGGEAVAGAMRSWAQQSGTAGFARTIRNLIGHFKEWLGLVGGVGRLVGAIFSAAAGSGRSLVRSLRGIVDRWREWIQENPEKVRRFFRNMADRARNIVRRIGDIVRWLRNELPDAAEKAKSAFSALAGPLRTLRGITKLISGDLEGLKDLQFERDVKGPRGRRGGGLGGILEDFILGSRHEGGTITGAGESLWKMQSGEEVIRAGVASQLRPQLKLLNAGVSPQLAFGGASNSRTVNINAPISVPGNSYPDARTLAAMIEMELRRGGG